MSRQNVLNAANQLPNAVHAVRASGIAEGKPFEQYNCFLDQKSSN
jgi:hypothetical protein